MRCKLQAVRNLHPKGPGAQILVEALPLGQARRPSNLDGLDRRTSASQRVAELPVLFSDDRDFAHNVCPVHAVRPYGRAPIIYLGKSSDS